MSKDADVVRRALMDLALCDLCKLEFPKDVLTDTYNQRGNLCPGCYNKYLASIWDIPLNGSEHNISGSVGKRLRGISFETEELNDEH